MGNTDSLKNKKKSAGIDENSPYLMKKCKHKLMKPLLHLINCTLEEGVFSDRLKLAVIKPLHKKGKESIKLIEKIILKRILEHFNNTDILEDFQHGFKKGRSIMSAAVQFVQHVLENINEKSEMAGVFLDPS
ncbi:uncharacterized protein LOC126161270 [Schistocerca cancellata]|uniref:uncharacterized protein LOC126161270 n=1 Tax=Schistocerca cancellata TaxID=274614 RepID=UPI002117F0A6|nr:uncharacterized protein LOC126161270 [Schistocerca cancellata]